MQTVPLALTSSCRLLQTLLSFPQMLALKQQRSWGAFSRHQLGPGPRFLPCSHTAAGLLRVWDGVLLQPGPHRAPQGSAALGRLTPQAHPLCVHLQDIGRGCFPRPGCTVAVGLGCTVAVTTDPAATEACTTDIVFSPGLEAGNKTEVRAGPCYF